MTVQMKRDLRRKYAEGRRMIVRDSVEDRSIGNTIDQARLARDRKP